ncbi:MAG: DUF58 domain-containing protein [Gammaproteobacteria bacterium]|nr:DUF58 domain-containing protein [Gammaproteobacteria bacterium]
MKTGDGLWAEVDELIALRAYASLVFKRADKKSSSPLAGGYVSPFRGRGIDFSEVRLYQPGDEIRSMDWRVTARTGKPHTKLFIEERERPVVFIQDFSPGMYFATRTAFKTVVASKIATVLAWAAAGHGDRIGAVLFNEQESKIVKPVNGNRGVLNLIGQLSAWSKKSPTEFSEDQNALEKCLRHSRSIIRPGALVYVLSDFRGQNRQSEMLLSEISRHADVVAIRVIDPIEHQLPGKANLKISDGHAFSMINTDNNDTASNISLQNQLNEQRFNSFCIKHGIHSLTCLTNEDFLDVIRHGLAKRQSVKNTGVRNAGSF